MLDAGIDTTLQINDGCTAIDLLFDMDFDDNDKLSINNGVYSSGDDSSDNIDSSNDDTADESANDDYSDEISEDSANDDSTDDSDQSSYQDSGSQNSLISGKIENKVPEWAVLMDTVDLDDSDSEDEEWRDAIRIRF